MRLSIWISLVFAIVVLGVSPAEAAKKKDEFADTRVCVTLGLDTNHPLKKVCTRKAETVEAAKWIQKEQDVHFIFQRSGNAYTSGLIQEKMDGGVEFDASALEFCVMEIPSFRGSSDEAQARIDTLYLSYLFGSVEKHSPFEDPESFRFVQRSQTKMFPEGCDVVAATGEDWKGSWKRVIEQISRNSSPNSKFTQEFKQRFTDSLNDLVVAFSLTPAEVEQGRVAGLEALDKRKDEVATRRVAVEEIVASGSQEGVAFLNVPGGGSNLCYIGTDDYLVKEIIKASATAQVMLKDSQTTSGQSEESLEEVFRAALGNECAVAMASPAEVGKLKDSLAKRGVETQVGWSYVTPEELAAANTAAVEARRQAEVEAHEKAEQERLAAIERGKARAEHEERERQAAIEKARTHPYQAVVSCVIQGNHIHVISCFDDTQLKITTNNRSRIYQPWEIENAGVMRGPDLHIDLPENFDLKAQNGSSGLTLSVVVMDRFNNVLYEDQASQYGVVFVGN